MLPDMDQVIEDLIIDNYDDIIHTKDDSGMGTPCMRAIIWWFFATIVIHYPGHKKVPHKITDLRIDADFPLTGSAMKFKYSWMPHTHGLNNPANRIQSKTVVFTMDDSWIVSDNDSNENEAEAFKEKVSVSYE